MRVSFLVKSIDQTKFETMLSFSKFKEKKQNGTSCAVSPGFLLQTRWTYIRHRKLLLILLKLKIAHTYTHIKTESTVFLLLLLFRWNWCVFRYRRNECMRKSQTDFWKTTRPNEKAIQHKLVQRTNGKMRI